jgi:hypothetical protein
VRVKGGPARIVIKLSSLNATSEGCAELGTRWVRWGG